MFYKKLNPVEPSDLVIVISQRYPFNWRETTKVHISNINLAQLKPKLQQPNNNFIEK